MASEKVELLAKNGKGNPITVTFLCEEGNLKITCTCKDGQGGKLCKHKRAFISGNEGYLFDPGQKKDLQHIHDWIKKTEFPILEARLWQAEIEESLHKAAFGKATAEGRNVSTPRERQNSLDLLDILIKTRTGGKQRTTTLLKDPMDEHPQIGYMYVSKHFNDALDIRQTVRAVDKHQHIVWTQGSSFSFKAADILFNTSLAYTSPWSEALKHINLCIQIESASPAVPASIDSDRMHGKVTMSIYTPDKSKRKIIYRSRVTMTQDDFVRFLIQGPTEEIKGFMDRTKEAVCATTTSQ